MTAVVDTIESETIPDRTPRRNDPETKRQPPYAVIIENDDLHTFEYVILLIQKVFGYNQQKAYLLTSDIHDTGRVVAWSGSKEVAELKCEQVKNFGPDTFPSKPVEMPLGCYIEPMP